MFTSREKRIRLNTPQALIELLQESSRPTHFPKFETDKISLSHSMSKKDCITLIEDYELMKKHLKKCGYKIDADWEVGLDGTITNLKPRKRLKKSKRKKLIRR